MVHSVDELGIGVFVGVSGVQPLDITEQHQHIRMDAAGHHGPQGVVVAHLDLGGGYGVVFVDDGEHPQLQQLQGILEVLTSVRVVDVLPGEEDLGHGVVVHGKKPVVGVHQLTLAHGRGGLLGGHILGLAGQVELAHPHADGAGGDQNGLVSCILQVRQHLHQLLHMANVQQARGVCQGGSADFHHNSHNMSSRFSVLDWSYHTTGGKKKKAPFQGFRATGHRPCTSFLFSFTPLQGRAPLGSILSGQNGQKATKGAHAPFETPNVFIYLVQ